MKAKTAQQASIGFMIFTIVIAVAAIGGWIGNIVKIVQSDFTWTSGMFIARCIGVFVATLGSVLGYL